MTTRNDSIDLYELDLPNKLNLVEVLSSERNFSESRANNSSPDGATHVYKNEKRNDFHSGLKKNWESRAFIDCHVSTTKYGNDNLVDFPCHRIVLSASSPLFASLIQAEESKSEIEEICSIEVNEVAPIVLRKMLSYLYTSSVSLTDDIVVDVFMSSHKFGIQGLQELCEQHVASHISQRSVLPLLMDAELHKAHTLKEKCLEFLKNNAAEIFQHQEDKILLLPRNCFRSVLELNFRMDEHTVFQITKKWAQKRIQAFEAGHPNEPSPSMKDMLCGIIDKVRLVSLRKSFLQHEVMPLGIVPEHMLMDVLFYKAKDPAYLEFQQYEPSAASENSNDLSLREQNDKMWLKPRGPIWKTIDDFANEQEYTEYMKSVLRPGMMLMALRSYESVQEGDVGEFVQWNTGIPPCQVRWEGYGSTYWLYFRDLVIVED